MKNRHSQFKSKHKILLSILSMLLLVSITSTSVFAEEGGASFVGSTTTGSTYNGDGVAGASYSDVDPENIWGKMTSDAEKSRANFIFMGYIMYVVDGEGNLQSNVAELTYKNPYEYSTEQKITTLMCGDVTEDKIISLQIYPTTNPTEVIEPGVPRVYTSAYYKDTTGTQLGGGTFVLGENFATWMQTKNSNGDKNSKVLLIYAFGLEEAQKYIKHPEWKVIIEPLLSVDIWTTREWISVEETHIVEKYKEHFMYMYEDVPRDICCSATDEVRIIKGSPEYNKWFAEHFAASYIGRPLYYGIPTHYISGIATGKEISEEALKELKAKYNSAINLGKDYERKAASELGYGYIEYEKLDSLEKKIDVYKRMANKGYAFNPETTYIKSIIDTGFVYLNPNPVYAKINGVEQTLYADYSVAYAHRPDKKGWHEKVEGGIRKHCVSAYTGVKLYSTYTGVRNHLATVTNLSGIVGSDGGCTVDAINPVGTGFKLSEKAIFTDSAGNKTKELPLGNPGIHMYGMNDIAPDEGDPINTYDIDNEPTIPAESEQPKKTETPESIDNTGKSTIVKVYGKVYKDGSNLYHIEDYKTFVTKDTTNEIIITDEYEKTGYKLTQWVVTTSTSSKTNINATDWATISSTNTILTTKLKDTLGISAYSMTSATKGLLHGEDNPLTIGEENETNTLYLLYLKEMPYIETSDTPIPYTPDPTQPKPTLPENPYSPTNPQPDKQGSYNIVKVYTLLDQYNGKPLSSEIYFQTQITPFIKIETESNWTLASWYTTNTYNTSIKGEDFFQEATTQAQLKSFYEKGYNIKPQSAITSVIGTPLSQGTNSTINYFSEGNTVYILFTRTQGQAEYNASQQKITESYLAKRFSTSGYWDITSKFHQSDLELKVTTESGTHTELFREHLFNITNQKLNGNVWTDNKITFRLIADTSLDGNIIATYSKIYKASEKYDNSPEIYSQTRHRDTFNTEAMTFKDAEYRFTAYRKGDTVNLSSWKNNDTNLESELLKDRVDASNNFMAIVQSNGFYINNKASVRKSLSFIDNITTTINIDFNELGSDLYTRTDIEGSNASITDIRQMEIPMGIKIEVFEGTKDLGKSPIIGSHKSSGKDNNIAYSGYRTSTLASESGSNKITFVPYVKMQFDSDAVPNNVVYVNGKYERELYVNEYAGIEFSVCEKNNTIVSNIASGIGKIRLSSNQWSMHATSTIAVGEGCVLPGGATLNMSIPKDNRNTVYVETMYPILTGSGLNQVVATGGNKGLSSALTELQQSEHDKFVQSVVNGLETLNVQQWVSEAKTSESVSEDILTDRKTSEPVWDMNKSQAVYYNGKDGKYYFRDDNDNDTDSGAVKSGDSNTGDLDVAVEDASVMYYTFYVNANGDIYCNKSDDLVKSSTLTSETCGQLVLAKGNDITKLLDEYKRINDKTAIITNLLAALEINKGNDKNAPWASEDGHWYNEAFDGVTYVVTRTAVKVGFINPYERTSLLDPELTPQNSGKGDLFSSYRYSQLKMKNACELYGTPDKIGVYRNEDICSDYLSEIMISDIFLIPNVTVQDLK